MNGTDSKTVCSPPPVNEYAPASSVVSEEEVDRERVENRVLEDDTVNASSQDAALVDMVKDISEYLYLDVHVSNICSNGTIRHSLKV